MEDMTLRVEDPAVELARLERGRASYGDSLHGFSSVVQAAVAGAEWAWARLYEDFAPYVRGYARGHGATDPDDLVSEVFLRAVKNLSSFEGGPNDFKAWILTIAHHRLVDEIRARTRRPLELAPDDVLAAHGAVRDAETEAVDRVHLAAVLDATRTLVPAQRDVLLLRVVAGLSVEEVARITGKGVVNVRVLQHRAVAALRRKIARDWV